MTTSMTELKGTTIGLVTPSSPTFPQRVNDSVAYFESAGLIVKTGQHHDKRDRFLAGTDQQRADDLMRAFHDPDIDILVVTGGGAGSARVLPYLDLEMIRANPKPIIGFSDTTSLQLGLYSQIGLMSYTGFTCRDVAEFETLDPLIESSFVHCVQKKNFMLQGGETLNPGQARGELVGGNLSCMNYLMGTRFQPNFQGKLLVIEDVWAEPYVIDSMLAQLSLAGVFDVVSGIIFGQFCGCKAQHHPERDGTVEDVLAHWAPRIPVPCVKEISYGHVPSRSMWPIGGQAILDANSGTVQITF